MGWAERKGAERGGGGTSARWGLLTQAAPSDANCVAWPGMLQGTSSRQLQLIFPPLTQSHFNPLPFPPGDTHAYTHAHARTQTHTTHTHTTRHCSTLSPRPPRQVMKALWVSKLLLWPRFQEQVDESLTEHAPEVMEVKVPLTRAMTNIQQAIADIMTKCVQELKLKRPSLEVDHFSLERGLTMNLDQKIRRQLDPVWNTLSSSLQQVRPATISA